ncbi:MAG: transcription termination/antitermination protein NusG [Planctomycetaceae bacterium]|jgi:transcriptional antiterminator NusG|nr:transcription termination/antitermination protein NusG [Planctomycetaceae bacterium]
MLEVELSELEKGGGEDESLTNEESVESESVDSVGESVVADGVLEEQKPVDETNPEEGSGEKKTAVRKKREPKTKEPKAKKSTGTRKTVKAGSSEAEAAKEREFPKGRNWYILKVQVNREDAIRKYLETRIKVTGLDEFFGDILVPTEKVTEIRNEKKRVVKRKLYPGYLMICMEINDDTWFLVRGIPGVGDFTGAVGKPTPMLPHEVQRMLAAEKEDPAESPKLKVGYSIGDQIKIKEGSFESLNGVVDAIDYTSGRVTVIVNLFGRSTPIELEYWQIEQSSG